MAHTLTFTAVLWEHDGPGAWHFISLPPDCTDAIAAMVRGRTKAFGAVRVTARIGATEWSTSLFPDKGRATYLLPVKRAVRTIEGLHDGAACEVQVTVAPDSGRGPPPGS